jgi:hypothetical protein
MSNVKIEKTINVIKKRSRKKNLSQPDLTRVTRNPQHEIKIKKKASK